ncbi:MAG: hypothetical protein WC444_06010 [Candidatus Paceibacterota bacterium]
MDKIQAREVLKKYILLTLGANNNEPIDMIVLDEGNGITRLELLLFLESNCIPELKEALDTLKKPLRVKVIITDGKHTYTEDVTDEIEDTRKYSGMDDATYENWTREVTIDNWIDFENNYMNHFLYGWCESFAQSDKMPPWIEGSTTLTIKVVKE